MIKYIKIPTKCHAYNEMITDVYVIKCINDDDSDDINYFHSYCDCMCYSKHCDKCSINALETARKDHL